jgi:hypothetical protein
MGDAPAEIHIDEDSGLAPAATASSRKILHIDMDGAPWRRER